MTDNVDKRFGLYWRWWAIILTVAFLVPELLAISMGREHEDTLSAEVWKLIGTRDGWSGWHLYSRLAMLGFLLWLTEHLVFGWF